MMYDGDSLFIVYCLFVFDKKTRQKKEEGGGCTCMSVGVDLMI